MAELLLIRHEAGLKWFALILGIASAVSVTMNWHFWAMAMSLPFCLIWMACAWLHNEKQLKYINALFTGLYIFGLSRYFLVGA